jgi:hypothetical protein
MGVTGFVNQTRVAGDGSFEVSAHATLDNTLSIIPDFVLRQLLRIVGSFLVDNFASRLQAPPKDSSEGASKVTDCLRARLREVELRPRL